MFCIDLSSVKSCAVVLPCKRYSYRGHRWLNGDIFHKNLSFLFFSPYLSNLSVYRCRQGSCLSYD